MSPEEITEMESAGMMPRPYMDQRLGGDVRLYENLVKGLESRGLVLWTDAPKENATMFFVRKKQGTLRMVVEARRANARFRAPPGTPMCTPEGLGKIELDFGGDSDQPGSASGIAVCGGTMDCFYRLWIRRSLAEHFALPPIRADSVGQRSATGWVWPCLSFLSMSFLLSLILAQQINEAEVGRAPALEDLGPASDVGGPIVRLR